MTSGRASLVSMCLFWAACLFWATAAPISFAEHPIPESERWATITHPGNEPYVFFTDHTISLGRVDYEYQISRTEVTEAEWYEFVVAYSPHVDPFFENRPAFTGNFIRRTASGSYTLPQSVRNRAVEIGWRFAARYLNWLHNDKRPEQAAFESGVYDTSTFGDLPGPDFGFTDQLTHSPGAQYWIASRDEWMKAAYFDPDKNGSGAPGYWQYLGSTDVPLIGGPPGLGGQTSAGFDWTLEHLPVPDVAAYRDVQSPWGLWDTSGGASEWTESPVFGLGAENPSERWVLGSAAEDRIFLHDRITYVRSIRPFTGNFGIRIVRPVPGAWSAGVFLCALSSFARRRRSPDETPIPDPHQCSCSIARTRQLVEREDQRRPSRGHGN